MKPKPRRKHFIITALLVALNISFGLCKSPPTSDVDADTNAHNRIDSSIPHASLSKHTVVQTQDLKAQQGAVMAKFGDKDTSHVLRLFPGFSKPSDDTIDLRGVSLSRYSHSMDADAFLPHDVDRDLSGRVPPENNDDPESIAGGQYVTVGGSSLIDSNAAVSLADDYEVPVALTHDVASEEEDDENKDLATSVDEVDNHSRKQRDRNWGWRRRQRSSPPPDTQKGAHRKRRRRHKLQMKALGRNNHLTSRKHHHRRDRFLLKSDGPGHVIFSADEVKRDWCRTIPFNLTVTAGRCRPKVVRNNLCYGQCNSFFIPQSDRTNNKVAFQSCSFCKPHRLRWVNVTLGCPGRHPPKIQKTILKVESCRCIAAEREEVDRNLEYLQRGTARG